MTHLHVPDLRHEILPLPDQVRGLALAGDVVLQERERPLEAPVLQLRERLAQPRLRLRARVHRADLVRAGRELVGALEEVQQRDAH